MWSFGEENYPIFVRYLRLREAMRPYIRGLMRQFHERGTPIMRPLFCTALAPSEPEAAKGHACPSRL